MDPSTGSSLNPRWIEGGYVNYFNDSNNAFEYLIDFGRYFPEIDQAELFAGIVTAPPHTEAILKTTRGGIRPLQEASAAWGSSSSNPSGC